MASIAFPDEETESLDRPEVHGQKVAEPVWTQAFCLRTGARTTTLNLCCEGVMGTHAGVQHVGKAPLGFRRMSVSALPGA